MFLAGTPTHRVRQVILEHSTAVSVVGPMHIVSTLIFFIGIVLRIFALEMRASLRLVYMVPLSTGLGCAHSRGCNGLGAAQKGVARSGWWRNGREQRPDAWIGASHPRVNSSCRRPSPVLGTRPATKYNLIRISLP